MGNTKNSSSSEKTKSSKKSSKTNLTNENPFLVQKTRKMHDIWAAFLYVICFSAFLVIGFFLQRDSDKIDSRKSPYLTVKFPNGSRQLNIPVGTKVNSLPTFAFYLGDAIKLMFLPITSYLVIIALFYTNPVFFVHVMFITSIILPILLGVFLSGIGFSAIIGSLITAFFYFLFFNKIKYVAKPFRMSIRILASGFGLFASVILINTVLSFGFAFCVQFFIGDKIDTTKKVVLGFFMTLMIFWTFFIIDYTSQVAMTALVAEYIINDLKGSALVKSAGKIVFYSIGQICFAALIIAVVTTLKYTVDSQLQNQSNRNSQDRNIVAIIMLVIFSALLDLLRDFLDFLNGWALTVISLKGYNLTKAMKSVFFDIKTGFITTYLASYLFGASATLSLFVLFGAAIFTDYLFFVKLTNEISQKYPYVYLSPNHSSYLIFNIMPLMFIIFSIFFICGLATSINKIMQMIYLIFSEDPQSIRRKDESVYESMREEAKSLGF